MNKRFVSKLGKLLKLVVLATILLVPGSYLLHQAGWFGSGYSSIIRAPEEIRGEKVTLRSLKEQYFIDYHNMFSSSVRKMMEFPDYITLDYTIRYLKLEMEKSAQGEQLLYCIFDNQENKLIGSIEIREKNETDPGQLGWWVNENYQGKGHSAEALKLIVHAYFKLHPEAKSFSAHVRLWNKRSYFALKKFGFKDVSYFYEGGQPTRYILEYRK
jgi:RimJ/RimL family protein N-acetyltransferase